MEFTHFLGIVAAVVVGNGVSLVFVYFLWRATKHENNGGDISYLPVGVLLCGLIPPLFTGLCFWLATY